MQTNELQAKMENYIDRWHRKRGVGSNEKESFIHLVEEVGELAAQYVNKEKRPEKYDPKEVENALGDIMFHIVEIARINNLQIESIITKIMVEEEVRLEEPDPVYLAEVKEEWQT
jgi:NTP pyrophosphatase (non-canonical NTP hydrolase)